MVKDGLPWLAVGGGGGLTQTSIPIFQIIGCFVGIIGLVFAVLRWYEAKRANDLNQQKWEHEIAQSQNSKKAEKQQTSGNSKSKRKTR